MISVSSPSLRRIASAVNARRYVVGGACLLIVAAALRFYGMSDYGLGYDEALAALNSKGAFGELLYNTRNKNSSPILYPIALWAVQQIESSTFSVRVMPAIASALTVGALLFVMPRVGVPRRAAFLAALLAALSVAAIEQAQNSREYSVDALVAALMIAGMLQYLRNGGRALLCVALFVGPLLQYGLVLFGAAALGAAALAPVASAQTGVWGARRISAAAVWGWLEGRIGLLLPLSAFAAGCGLSWWLTARNHLMAGSWNAHGKLAGYYYEGGFDVVAMAQFAIGRTWDMAIYHMPTVIAAGALLAFGALALAWALRRRRLDAIALLCAWALGAAVCAALYGAYPLGDTHQNLYLGPIIFLAAGGAFNALADGAAAVARRAWVGTALAGLAAVAIAIVGANAIWQGGIYGGGNNILQVLDALDEREQDGDAVYVYGWAVESVQFYKGENPPANYFYQSTACPGGLCVLDEMFIELGEARRIWLIHNVSVSVPEEIAAYSQEIGVEQIAHGWHTLHLITDFEEAAADLRKEWLAMKEAEAAAEAASVDTADIDEKEWLDMYDAVASEAPSAVSDYNLHLRDDALYYLRRPCAAADTETRFFLHIYPEDAADLPADNGSDVLENLDFRFPHYGFRADDRCIIRRALPEYPIERIHTGQFINSAWGVVWEAYLPPLSR